MENINDMETWKVIEATDGKYEVSDQGRVRKGNRIIPITHTPYGYCQVRIGLKFGSRHFLLHRVVAAYFVDNDNPTIKDQVNHIDGDKNNNRAENLEWCTAQENQTHKIKVLGKGMEGSKNPMYGVSGKDSPVFKGYILQVDPNTNEVVGRYAGSGEASLAAKGTRSNILRVLGKDKTYHGYKWVRETLR